MQLRGERRIAHQPMLDRGQMMRGVGHEILRSDALRADGAHHMSELSSFARQRPIFIGCGLPGYVPKAAFFGDQPQ